MDRTGRWTIIGTGVTLVGIVILSRTASTRASMRSAPKPLPIGAPIKPRWIRSARKPLPVGKSFARKCALSPNAKLASKAP